MFIVADASTAGWPEPTPSGIVGNEFGVVVPVHHASDVTAGPDWPSDVEIPPAEVDVAVFRGDAGDEPVSYDAKLMLPSGRLTVGDADGLYELRLMPGRWRVQVGLDQPEFADSVRLWISEAS